MKCTRIMDCAKDSLPFFPHASKPVEHGGAEAWGKNQIITLLHAEYVQSDLEGWKPWSQPAGFQPALSYRHAKPQFPTFEVRV